jgi:hypothetical protein
MANSVRNLALVRFALLGGVLLFGAVCWFVTDQRGGGPQADADPAALAVFRVLVPALCLGAIAVATVLRGRVARERDAAKRDSLRMIAWAVGEGTALMGGVYYFKLGDPKLYVLGVVAMLATFIILPLRET